MRYIGEQRARVSGARRPFTPVSRRLELESEIEKRQRKLIEMYRRMNIVLLCVAGAAVIGFVAAVIYHASRAL